jgi:hypothetical protein
MGLPWRMCAGSEYYNLIAQPCTICYPLLVHNKLIYLILFVFYLLGFQKVNAAILSQAYRIPACAQTYTFLPA